MTTDGQDDQHVSMLAYRGFGQKLITSSAALELARAVLRDNFADAEISREGDLKAVDAGDWWHISSTQPATGTGTGTAYQAKLRRSFDMEVSQFDGRIRKLTFD